MSTHGDSASILDVRGLIGLLGTTRGLTCATTGRVTLLALGEIFAIDKGVECSEKETHTYTLIRREFAHWRVVDSSSSHQALDAKRSQ